MIEGMAKELQDLFWNKEPYLAGRLDEAMNLWRNKIVTAHYMTQAGS